MVPSSGDLDAASVIEGFLRQHPRGELRLGTGYGSAYGLAWLHHRTRRRPVRLLVGDLRTGFDRSSDDDRKAALAFLSRDDVSVRGCHAPDGMLHSKVWIALDAAGSERPSSLLETLGGVDLVPCDSLPLEARPLRLTGDANPAGYAVAHDTPDLVCTWLDVGIFVAGETIPAGDLRAVNATVHGAGACRFEVYDQTGAVVVSRADYELQGWVSYALLRLHPGTTITTSGCGWVPAEHAGLGPGPDHVIGAAQHAGRRYPLIVGVDVPPATVLIECDFWAWPDARPDENGSWADALPRREDERRAPGPYRAETGIIWPEC